MTIGDGILGAGICYLLTHIIVLIYRDFINPKHNTPTNEERLQKIEELLRENGLDI